MQTLRKLIVAAVLLALAALAPPAAHAVGITYTVSGTGSGTLGNQAFTNAAFTIVSTADTAAAMETPEAGFFVNPDITSSVTVAGIGTGIFTSATESVTNQNLAATAGGIADPIANLAILLVVNPAFATYDLTTSFGPVSQSNPGGFNGATPFGTTAGDFILANVPTATFQATLNPVPEASTTVSLGLLLILGLGGVIVLSRKKRVKA